MNKPTKPNITIPASFAANGVKAAFDNNKILNGFDRLQPDVLAGDNLNKFIDDTYKGLNYSMAAADAINLINEGETLTVVDGQLASSTLTENFVNKTGDTMTGILTLAKAQGNFIIKEPNLDYTTIPSNQSISSFRLSDKNGFALGDVRFTRTTSGDQSTTLYARNKINGTDKTTTVVASVSATGNRYVNLNTDVINVNNVVMPYVKSRVISGTSWYEIWSDGTIKQGGQILLSSGAGLKTFTLVKNYTTDTYILTGFCKFNEGVDGNGSDQAFVNAVRLSSQTISTFTLQSAMSEATYFNWEATGK